MDASLAANKALMSQHFKVTIEDLPEDIRKQVSFLIHKFDIDNDIITFSMIQTEDVDYAPLEFKTIILEVFNIKGELHLTETFKVVEYIGLKVSFDWDKPGYLSATYKFKVKLDYDAI